MNLSSNAFAFLNKAKEKDEDDFFRQIGPIGLILVGICIIWFIAVIGFGIYISIKYFRMNDVVEFANVDLKKRRILIVIHVYIWSIFLSIYVLFINDASDFPFTSELPDIPDISWLNWSKALLLLPVYIKFHFIFFLNLHYVLVRNENYSNWKVNYVLENYRLYLGLAMFGGFAYEISWLLPKQETGYLIFMGIYVGVILLMIAADLGDTSKIKFDAEQPKTQLKVLTQAIHFVSMLISASAIAFYSAENIRLRLFIMILIFIEPTLLTLSQYLIYRAKLRDTAALFDTEFQSEESLTQNG